MENYTWLEELMKISHVVNEICIISLALHTHGIFNILPTREWYYIKYFAKHACDLSLIFL